MRAKAGFYAPDGGDKDAGSEDDAGILYFAVSDGI